MKRKMFILMLILFLSRNHTMASTWTNFDGPNAIRTGVDAIYGNKILGYYITPENVVINFVYDGSWTYFDFPGYEKSSNDIYGTKIVGRYIKDMNRPNIQGFIYDYSSNTLTSFPLFDFLGGIYGDKVTGYHNDYSSPSRAFISNTSDSLRFNLNSPPGAIGTWAFGIDSNDNIAGYFKDPSDKFHGILYNDTNYTVLDFPGAINTWAYHSDDTNVVGRYEDVTGLHGFLYDGNEWTTLDMPGAGPLGTNPRGIQGDIIVGSYYDVNGRYHGFIYDINGIPEPSTIALLISGLIVGGGLYLRRRK